MKLYNGNCLDVMQQIPDGSVDMILTDLPYGTTQNKWDSCIPTKPLWEEYKRVTKENAAILLFAQPPFDTTLVMSNRNMFRYEWIWHKVLATGFLNAKRMPLKSFEQILVFYSKLPTYNPQFQRGKEHKRGFTSNRASTNYGKYKTIETGYNSEYYPTDLIEFSQTTTKLHPTQKPVELCEYLIKTYTNKGETVLDSCMGSGTTGVAAKRLQRHFIGIELDKGYFDIASERIAKTPDQTTLFDEEDNKSER